MYNKNIVQQLLNLSQALLDAVQCVVCREHVTCILIQNEAEAEEKESLA